MYRQLVVNIRYLNNIARRFLKKSRKHLIRLRKITQKYKLRKWKPVVYSKIKYLIIGLAVGIIFIWLPLSVHIWLSSLPSINMLGKKEIITPTKILDRNGKLLYEIYNDYNYTPVKLGEIPDDFVKATLAIEDSGFYTHRGVSVKSIIRAAFRTVVNDSLQGGSTITQQLVKNVLLSPERTLERKVKEAVLAIAAEIKYPKDKILEMYLNNISYGGDAWGVQSASIKYFGKKVSELNLAESALLSGLPSSPTKYSPYINREKSKERQVQVLQRMRDLGYIDDTRYREAVNYELKYTDEKEYIRAPHFVTYVISELVEKYGKRYVEKGGLVIYTTLDLDLQESVQTVVTEEIIKAEDLEINNGAAVVIDVGGSEILAYAGSVDYFKEEWGKYDAVRSDRQPGSSIKPVTYSTALAKGFSAATVINDSPVRFKIQGAKDYMPVNYDGRYHGNVTIRTALANSYNIPAVKLAYQLGPDNIVTQGKKMGLDSWEADGTYGLSVTLGGKEVKLMELANVYSTLARGGVKKNLEYLLKIEDNRGNLMYEKKPQKGERALSEEAAFIISHILSDNEARRPAFGNRSSLELPGRQVAVKTGTTDNKRDNWTLGYTPSFVVGVWVGNNDNKPMHKSLSSGLSGAAPIWNKITTHIFNNTNYHSGGFTMPDGVYVFVDKECGGKSEIFIKGNNNPRSLCWPEDKKDKADSGRTSAIL